MIDHEREMHGNGRKQATIHCMQLAGYGLQYLRLRAIPFLQGQGHLKAVELLLHMVSQKGLLALTLSWNIE
jgi:hypothetical protein